ncbi:hypothetical protein HMPREF9237_00541 [Actinotignum schaalii FB123-CNA-2]|uniref:Uncharacterized protein n=1 Tax=Actinotignum schaalii FB123-CNA-2 TaxID=883067 RepID=S2W4J3_9ACTO|nr:hypothetical protein HMPREF9237_00541 [Actinotignum schaalii FB123-CNA-2]
MCCQSCSAYVVHAKYISEKHTASRLRGGPAQRLGSAKCAFWTLTPAKCAFRTVVPVKCA